VEGLTPCGRMMIRPIRAFRRGLCQTAPRPRRVQLSLARRARGAALEVAHDVMACMGRTSRSRRPCARGDVLYAEPGSLIHARTRVPGRLGKATSRTPSMYVDEKSDEAIFRSPPPQSGLREIAALRGTALLALQRIHHRTLRAEAGLRQLLALKLNLQSGGDWSCASVSALARSRSLLAIMDICARPISSSDRPPKASWVTRSRSLRYQAVGLVHLRPRPRQRLFQLYSARPEIR